MPSSSTKKSKKLSAYTRNTASAPKRIQRLIAGREFTVSIMWRERGGAIYRKTQPCSAVLSGPRSRYLLDDDAAAGAIRPGAPGRFSRGAGQTEFTAGTAFFT